MVCVPCIFVGLAIVIWCKYLEPYIKPIYQRLCQYYPPLSIIGDQMIVWGEKLEKFAGKFGIRMPESCPMPKKTKSSSKVSNNEKTKLYPDLTTETITDDQNNLHHRTVPSTSSSSINE